MSRLKVALLFGGRSGEHEVSRNSAFAVATALSSSFDVLPIGIAKDGQWYAPIPLSGIKEFIPEDYSDKKVTILPYPTSKGVIYSLPKLEPIANAQVFFPVMHGTFGEDGTMQGLFELAEVPYVGAGVLASSVGMDKVMMKKAFAEAKLPQVPFLSFLRIQIEKELDVVIAQIEDTLGYPCFVKPVNMGSSVGISKANDKKGLEKAMHIACRYDRKIIIEKGVSAREIEVSVLGNDTPRVSIPGEIIPCNDFYDYTAKYIDDRSELHIPAKIEKELQQKIQELAIVAYKSVDCSGLARIDFFLTKDTGEILINEINTIPGFTNISMYPKLWEFSGIPFNELVKHLIDLALERAEQKKLNILSYDI
ncbi:MAG: D-alanine--D-alanine ligase A [Firmicutes bacterium HGW-Firmicutes-12]|nr:MAG: D-alanine--D-alanine ligase A [Firmicutes bacterium HGW-Firmicutes-12]